MPASHLGRRRSRPVADAPVLDGAELAKAWLVELVAIAPLERAARLPGPRFSEDAPRLCAAVVAALSSDAALDDLEPGGALAPLAAGAGHLAAASGPHEAVVALDALRTVTWAALLDAADRPVPAQVADLADRLGTVIATITTATLESAHPLGPTRPGDRGPLGAVLREARPGERDRESVDPAPLDEPGGERVEGPRAEGLERPRAERVEEPRGERVEEPSGERGDGPSRAGVEAPPPPRAPRSAADVVVESARKRPADALAEIEAALRDAAQAADPLAEAVARLKALGQPEPADPFADAATRLRATTPPREEPRIRRLPHVEDASAADSHLSPWAAAIERRLARHRDDGRPFAVLCLELVDADRLVAADLDRDVAAALEHAEAAILSELRPADALVRERPGRYWLTTPETDAAEARALGHRIASAVGDLPPHRGAALQLAIGVATCPDDATDAQALESGAEEALFAARAGGVRVAGPPARA